jgi:RNA polymerase sigma-70 factor (ECF subfamily)
MNHPEEFEEIYTTYREKIKRFLVRMAGEAEAEDLAQEVFLKINHALATYRGESSLQTWIYRIAYNTAIDHHRKNSQEVSRLDMNAEEADGDTTGIDPCTGEPPHPVESLIYREEMKSCLWGYIDHLPDSWRPAFILSAFEGLSNKEVAGVLNLSLNTVKIRLHRARKFLKEQLLATCDPVWVVDNEFLPELKFDL